MSSYCPTRSSSRRWTPARRTSGKSTSESSCWMRFGTPWHRPYFSLFASLVVTFFFLIITDSVGRNFLGCLGCLHRCLYFARRENSCRYLPGSSKFLFSSMWLESFIFYFFSLHPARTTARTLNSSCVVRSVTWVLPPYSPSGAVLYFACFCSLLSTQSDQPSTPLSGCHLAGRAVRRSALA